MLTSAQTSIEAYATEDNELLLCENCFLRSDIHARPVTQFELSADWQEDYDYHYFDEDVEREHSLSCLRGVYCSSCDAELVKAWHDHDETEDDT